MDLFSRVTEVLADGRLGANLIAVHGILTILVLAYLILRRLINRGSTRLSKWTGFRWLETAGEEAARRLRSTLFWLTIFLVCGTVAGGLGYHLAGRDIRDDLRGWYEHLSATDLASLGARCGGLLAIIFLTSVAVRLIRGVRPSLEEDVKVWVERLGSPAAVENWFTILQVYANISIRLTALWLILSLVGLGDSVGGIVGLVLQILTIVVVARILTLSCRLLANVLAYVGDQYLNRVPYLPYWERVKRLFPFGERCFEAAVYVSAASQCIYALQFINTIAEYGPPIVKCIGIFFATRVLIELLQVLLAEAFGMNREGRQLDQKGQTLVPLLQSVGQYVLYFGSAIVMLGVLGINTLPILTGAGILGLAVGLGAQSLVTDVVSGFFILFENQYLVGDYVQIGDAVGTVEAVGIRVTQIRDGQGKVHIIPNGQIKGVVSFSKGFINAVVDWKVPAGSDLEGTMKAMTLAGQRLRQSHPHLVLAETQIHALLELTGSDMTLRAITKVRPGSHWQMQNEFRRLLKTIPPGDIHAVAVGKLAA